jgi:hypothetical protein
MSFIFGGGSSAPAPTQSGSSVVTQREAPGVEARKLALYDEAAKLAAQPVSLPAIQAAPATAAEQAAFQQAAQTGTGQPTVTAGIGSILGAQTAAATPLNVSQFFNPFQQFVTDEINRQAQIGQTRLAAQAVGAGAFGGGRQGVAQAELERARLSQVGLAQQAGFQQALGAAERQRNLQAQTGLQSGQLLGALGGQQQQLRLQDIQSALQAGGVQRGIGQAGLEAARQTQLQRSFEPFQRIEFLKGILTNLPTTQSSITATTAPGSNPLAQALGTGLGAYSAYQFTRPGG